MIGPGVTPDMKASILTEAESLTDQVEKTWEARRATQVDAEPESDTNDMGQTHVMNAAVFDQFGDAVASVLPVLLKNMAETLSEVVSFLKYPEKFRRLDVSATRVLAVNQLALGSLLLLVESLAAVVEPIPIAYLIDYLQGSAQALRDLGWPAFGWSERTETLRLNEMFIGILLREFCAI